MFRLFRDFLLLLIKNIIFALKSPSKYPLNYWAYSVEFVQIILISTSGYYICTYKK